MLMNYILFKDPLLDYYYFFPEKNSSDDKRGAGTLFHVTRTKMPFPSNSENSVSLYIGAFIRFFSV